MLIPGIVADSQVIPSSAAPSELIFHCEWSASVNADVALGSATNVASSGVSISTVSACSRGFADFEGTGIPYIHFATGSNYNASEGAMRWVMTTRAGRGGTQVYGGIHGDRNFSGDILNGRFLIFSTGNNWRLACQNAAGQAVSGMTGATLDSDTGLVSGSTYEIEVNWRAGATASVWIYQDGVRAPTTLTGSWVNTVDASAVISFGVNTDGGGTGIDCMIRDFRIYDAVQHDASTYTPIDL
jgi:hypothetical protein